MRAIAAIAAACRGVLALLTLVAGLGAAFPATAFTAVAVSDRIGYGYCFNMADAGEAESCAIRYCRQYASDAGTCAIGYRSGTAYGFFSLATGNRRWGIGYGSTAEDADRYALQYCASDTCSVGARWQETVGMPELATLPPLTLDDPAGTVVLVTTHGSGPENMADRCYLSQLNVGQGMSSAVASLDGRAIDGLVVKVDRYCTPHKLGTATSLKVELRKSDLRERVLAYRRMGVPAHQIFVVGHSAGGWAGLLLKLEEPDLFNAVIAAAPAFAGETATRSQWWWDTRAWYLQRMAAARDLSSLVLSFASDTFETPADLPELAGAAGVEFVAFTDRQMRAAGCPEWTHNTFLSACFEPNWGNLISDYLAERL